MNRRFAHLPLDEIIDQIVVVPPDAVNDLPFPESEPLGQAFLNEMYGNTDTWLETSKTGAFRGRYARIGDMYDATLDEFVMPPEPQPEPDPEEGT